MKICIDSDRTGKEMKLSLLRWLREEPYQVLDLDARETDEYPEIAHRMALEIADGNFDRGILICGTGLGMAMMANKTAGIYAGTPQNDSAARKMASSNNAQIITFGCQVTAHPLIRSMLKAYLETPFEIRRNAIRMRELENA